jgi:PadR family transcriptional regulator AphA
MRQLTPTSYAVLGLLAVRPSSAYELIGQMQRSIVRLVWPRAESKLYEEPKNLVTHGLATVRQGRAGGRRRTVYRITPRGRRALGRWLDQPGTGPFFEFESMLKVVYADFGTKEQLLTNVRRIRDDAVRRVGLSQPLARELADMGPRFPERAHINAITGRFVIEVMQATLRWAQWAERIVERWPDTSLNAAMAAEARTLLKENADVVEAMVSLAPPRAADHTAKRKWAMSPSRTT